MRYEEGQMYIILLSQLDILNSHLNPQLLDHITTIYTLLKNLPMINVTITKLFFPGYIIFNKHVHYYYVKVIKQYICKYII